MHHCKIKNMERCDNSDICTIEKVDIAADSLQLVHEYDKEAVSSKHCGIHRALVIDDNIVASIDVHLTVATE